MTQHTNEADDRSPYPDLARLRATCPVQRMEDGSGPSYLVTGHAEARQALLDPTLSKNTAEFFADRPSPHQLHPAVSQTMLATDPPAHTRLRRMVASAFSTGTVEGLRPYIEQLTENLVDAFGRPRVDLVEALAAPLPVTVIGELLGVPAEDRTHLRTLSGDLFTADSLKTIADASHAMAQYMDQFVTAKRKAPGDDLLTRLLASRDSDGNALTQFELTSMASLLLIAGHETTTNAIGNALLGLFRHPEALARLVANPDQIESAVDELLRYDSAVSLTTFRWTKEPTVLGEQTIDAGLPVLISLGAANRDPVIFANPDTIDLDRDARAHLAFGHGIHRCLGAPLARAEVAIALRTLLTRHPDIALAEPVETLKWRNTRLVRGLVALPVEV